MTEAAQCHAAKRAGQVVVGGMLPCLPPLHLPFLSCLPEDPLPTHRSTHWSERRWYGGERQAEGLPREAGGSKKGVAACRHAARKSLQVVGSGGKSSAWSLPASCLFAARAQCRLLHWSHCHNAVGWVSEKAKAKRTERRESGKMEIEER